MSGQPVLVISVCIICDYVNDVHFLSICDTCCLNDEGTTAYITTVYMHRQYLIVSLYAGLLMSDFKLKKMV